MPKCQALRVFFHLFLALGNFLFNLPIDLTTGGMYMGYRIDYTTGQAQREKLSVLPKKAVAKVSGILGTLLVLAMIFGLCGEQIKNFLLPGDPVVTETALQEMAVDIREGEDFRDAFAAFCQKIIDGADLYE